MPPRDRQACQWGDCKLTFEDPDALFEHLADDHVGRRSTNNLCLICRWNDCGAQAAKRDHLTSHLRVHLPIKPHTCTICKKAFKRPQDLKKHEKIHTFEHKASLMSNQPGYKAVRRRRKPVNDDSKQSSRATSSASPDANRGQDRSISDQSYRQSTDGENDTIYSRAPSIDPLQTFFHDVLDNRTLSPEYNADMMNRLNTVSDFVHKDQPLSLGSADELDAMQLWLEQLAANIETGTCIYPSSNPPLSPGEQSLYPTQQQQQQQQQQQHHPYPAAWASMISHTGNPLTASLLDTSSPLCHPPSMSSSSSSPENQPESVYPTAPKFWTPGVTADVDMQKIDGPTPSEEVDFSQPPPMTQSQPQPLHLFQTQHEEAGLFGQQKTNKSWTLEERKDVVQLLNALSAPDLDAQRAEARQSNSHKNTTNQKTDSDLDTVEYEDDDSDEHSTISLTPAPDTDASSVKRPISLLLSKNLHDDSKDEKDSPYATLIHQLRDLSCEESEYEKKRRHAETVDLLWHAINRSKAALSKKNMDRMMTPPTGAASKVF